MANIKQIDMINVFEIEMDGEIYLLEDHIGSNGTTAYHSVTDLSGNLCPDSVYMDVMRIFKNSQ